MGRYLVGALLADRHRPLHFAPLQEMAVCDRRWLPFNLEVNQAFIAAILTIIGYTINDTVVVFDRIREYLVFYPKRDLRENVNNALNATLSRTINTSGTTLVTLLAILFFGGETIRGFIFALALGVVVGTLSTLFVATPIAYGLMKREGLGKK